MSFTPGDIKMTPMGPSQQEGRRSYSLGGVVVHDGGALGKWRLSGQVDVENRSGRLIALGDVWGNGRLKFMGQGMVSSSKLGSESFGDWATTTTLKGEEQVGVLRVKSGPEVGLSYSSRLLRGSPITLGGELMVSLPGLAGFLEARGGKGGVDASAAKVGGAVLRRLSGGGGGVSPSSSASQPSIYEMAFGLAYDAEDSKSALHYASTKSFSSGIISLQHSRNVTDRSQIAAKFITDSKLKQSMAAVGYRMKFRNTLTTMHGMLDTYGSVRQVRLPSTPSSSPSMLFSAQPPLTH